jgi:DNA (cytosine-5)-methyltransferase 1
VTLTIGSLFAGIGGLELGLERGLGDARVAWQVEIDPFCRRVLGRHWPNAKRLEDIRTAGATTLDVVDVICGGFPCQDISVAGRGAGLEGARSGLWAEMARVVRELRPRVVVVENVPALLARGLDRVLGDLASLGFDAEWDVHSAASVGAPHLRERLFVIATDAERHPLRLVAEWDQRQGRGARAPERGHAEPVDDGDQGGAAGWARAPASSVGRVDDGLFPGMERPRRPSVVDDERLKALGNAVVPQVAERVGRRVRELLSCEGAT